MVEHGGNLWYSTWNIVFCAKLEPKRRFRLSKIFSPCRPTNASTHILMHSTMITLPLWNHQPDGLCCLLHEAPLHHTIVQHPPNNQQVLVPVIHEDLAVRCHKSTFHISRRGRCHVAGPYQPCSCLQQVNKQNRPIRKHITWVRQQWRGYRRWVLLVLVLRLLEPDLCSHCVVSSRQTHQPSKKLCYRPLVKSQCPTNEMQQRTNDNHRL
jgi:hypothetical protein